jgi:hypothetical protein
MVQGRRLFLGDRMRFLALLTLLICSGASAQASPESVWRPLTVMLVQAPLSYATTIDANTNNLPAMQAAINALPTSGGIVWFDCAAGNMPQVWRKDGVLSVTKSHVKFWAAKAGCASIFARTNGAPNSAAIRFQGVTGAGFFGLAIKSDATARSQDERDAALTFENSTGPFEVESADISGVAQDGIFVDASTGSYISGNYIHHTWADHIHHTHSARTSYVWGNKILNEGVGHGDDGIACVTYLPESRAGDMEWWSNVILHSDKGRGLSVIGCDHINIHDNWIYGTEAAGIIVASETSFNSDTSDVVTIANNRIHAASQGITSHSGILISGLNPAVDPITNVTSTNNVVYGQSSSGFRAEGAYSNVYNTGMITSEEVTPAPPALLTPSGAPILRTRDVSHVSSTFWPGLYRIHVRHGAAGFEQRFEYAVKGDPGKVAAWCAYMAGTGAYVVERRTVSGTAYALALTPSPVMLMSGLSGVSFAEMRGASLDWLWTRADSGAY